MNNPLLSIIGCTKCSLCHNQPPLIQMSNNTDVVWVGLSAVRTTNINETPLAVNTNSGKLIYSIETSLPEIIFHKTNLVKCLPLQGEKIRYPSNAEMKNCYFNLKLEVNYLKPKIIFLLGKQVASFVLKQHNIQEIQLSDEFLYQTYFVNGILFVPIHHPSYILVYKRKKVDNYIKGIVDLILGRIKSTRKLQIQHSDTIASLNSIQVPTT
jgi:uracil-DNA glycosylase